MILRYIILSGVIKYAIVFIFFFIAKLLVDCSRLPSFCENTSINDVSDTNEMYT